MEGNDHHSHETEKKDVVHNVNFCASLGFQVVSLRYPRRHGLGDDVPEYLWESSQQRRRTVDGGRRPRERDSPCDGERPQRGHVLLVIDPVRNLGSCAGERYHGLFAPSGAGGVERSASLAIRCVHIGASAYEHLDDVRRPQIRI